MRDRIIVEEQTAELLDNLTTAALLAKELVAALVELRKQPMPTGEERDTKLAEKVRQLEVDLAEARAERDRANELVSIQRAKLNKGKRK